MNHLLLRDHQEDERDERNERGQEKRNNVYRLQRDGLRESGVPER